MRGDSVPVSVWWDFNNCRLPKDKYSAYRVVQRITDAVRANGIYGPIEIKLYGNTKLTNTSVLSKMGIKLIEIPLGGKINVYKTIIVRIICSNYMVGMEFFGKLFNQPPGDPRVYGYYEAPLEDPWDDEWDNNLLVQKLQKYGLRSLPRSDIEKMINLLLFDNSKEWAKLFKPYIIEADSEEGGIRSEKDAKSSLKNEEENSSNDSCYNSKGVNNGETNR